MLRILAICCLLGASASPAFAQASAGGKGKLPRLGAAWHDRLLPYSFGDLAMLPNVLPNQGLWVNHQAYEGATPALGEVVLLRNPAGDLQVRRVVGLAGDSVSFESGKPLRNGKRLEVGKSRACKTPEGKPLPCARERLAQASFDVQYAAARIIPEFPLVEVPQGHLFVLGDYRDRSEDSRSYDPVALTAIMGRVEAVSACTPKPRDGARPGPGKRQRALNDGVFLDLPAGFTPTRSEAGSQVLAQGQVVISVVELKLGVRGVAHHFRKVAAESGATATSGKEEDFAGHCGFLVEGEARVGQEELVSLWALVGDEHRSVIVNLHFPRAQAGKWRSRARRILGSTYWQP